MNRQVTTRTKRRLLIFVQGYLAAHGVGPTVREMSGAIGFRGLQTVTELLDQLEDEGAIRRLPRKARAIEVLAPPAIPMIGDAPLYAVPGSWDAWA